MLNRWRPAPALSLLLSRVLSGMRDMPQLSFFLVYLQERGGMSPVEISCMVSGAQLAGMGAALLGGMLATRSGIKFALMLGLALQALSSLVFQTRAIWLVAALWLLGGAGSALVTVGGSTYITRLRSQGAVGLLAALYALSPTVGGALGNPLAGLWIERRGFAAFGQATVVVSVCAILIVFFGIPRLAEAETDNPPTRAGWSSLLPMLRRRQTQRLTALRALPTLFYGMASVLVPLALHTLSRSKVTVAAYGTCMLVVASAAQLLAGRSADRWGGRLPSLVAYGALVLSGLGLAVSTRSVVGLFVCGVLAIAAAWALSTLMFVWVEDGVAKDQHPAVFGFLHAVWSLCMIGGSLWGGWLTRLSPSLPFVSLSLLNVGSLFLCHAYYRRTEVQAGE